MNDLITRIKYVAKRSTELKNKLTNASTAPIEFLCIFCQNEEEYKEFTDSMQILGKIVQATPSRFTYLLNHPIKTESGPLQLVKIRKQDAPRSEKGDADFNTDYSDFKKKCVLMLTCANQKESDKIAKSLLEKKLIVCSKTSPVSSSFLWKEKIESSDEILLLMNSLEENFEKIKKEVRKLHSYETFVLTSLKVNQTTKEVENWAKTELK